jgi:multidrug efflux pump subunit AcrA (membrane-fusion protein)
MTEAARAKRGAPAGPAAVGPSITRPTGSGPTVSGPTVSGPTVSGPTVSGPRNETIGAEQSGALLLLKVEAEIRDASDLHELRLAVANETRSVLRARQIFVFDIRDDGAMRLEAISGLHAVDRSAALPQWIERLVARMRSETKADEIQNFQITSFAHAGDPGVGTFPFREALWLPVRRLPGGTLGGLLLVRETPWAESDQVLARRLVATISHAWAALLPRSSVRGWGRLLNRRRAVVSAAVLACASLFPVSMSTLAPLEIAPRDAFIVAAPIDGVIEDVPVAANVPVVEGDVLVRLVDATARNRFAVAEREVLVSEARFKKMTLLAFGEAKARHELGIARAELAVRIAERDHAREILARTQVVAPRSGLAIFGEKRELIGRPVSTGEKLMEIADPRRVEIRMDVPVGDSIILAPGAEVTAFLDSDPLRPLSATVVRADYQAKTRESGVASYRVVAEIDGPVDTPPRLGIRGTAQLHGSRVSLAFYLLRRPIGAIRQWTGI